MFVSSLPLTREVDFAKQKTQGENNKREQPKLLFSPSVSLTLNSSLVRGSQGGQFTSLLVTSICCMAVRPTKRHTCAPPVSVRAKPKMKYHPLGAVDNYSVRSAITGSFLAAILEGISPEIKVKNILITTRIIEAFAGSIAKP